MAAMSSDVSRRAGFAAAVLMLLAPACAAEAAPAEPKVAILGDSITAGYGLPARQALPAKLSSELARMGDPVRIVPAGISGDTTGGGLRRLDRAVPAGTKVCVVALGGNDLLNGEDPARMRANLKRIVERLKARGVTVVLAGLKVPPVLGGAYGRAFDAAFATVAKDEGVIFMPDLLDGVVLNPDLNQHDGIHPNARGVEIIARRLAPFVAQALKRA
jgi:acyl-CoA thioesterase-1